MRFTPLILAYLVVLMIAAIAVRELNQCTVELRQHKEHKHE